MTRKRLLLILVIITFIGLLIRLFRIDFGLPLTYFPDETDLSDVAIKYTLGYKSALQTHNIDFFKPDSFKYGTFPTYLLTTCLVIFNKITSIFNIGADYFGYIVVMRIVTACISMLIPFLIGFIYYKLFKDKKGLVISVLLTALNWKLIYHSHYSNQDTFLTVAITTVFLFVLLYFNSVDEKKSILFIFLSGIALGLAAGTKITALLTLPLLILLLILKKNWKGTAFCTFGVLLSYILSNPFSVIAFNDFIARVFEMGPKEGGVIFSSVDLNPFKYLVGLNYMLTFPVLIAALYGIIIAFLSLKSFKLSDNKKLFHVFLILNVLTYIIFFSLVPRRSDRFLLPILSIIMLYAAYGTSYLYNHLKISRYLIIGIVVVAVMYYLYFPFSLALQLTKNKPCIDAYYWMAQQQLSNQRILVYTEDGRDPFSKIKGADVIMYSIYVSKGAQLSMPQDPLKYDYVVLASKPMDNYKKDYIVKNYPEYFNNWGNFENLVTASDKFSLIKEFKMTNLNLLYFSDISIYKKN